MAEVKKLKGKRTAATQKLTATLVRLENLITEDIGMIPTEVALGRQETTLQNAWESYETAHLLYLEVLDEGAAEGEAEGFQVLFIRHDVVVVQVEDLLAKRRGLVVDQVPEVTNVALYTGAKVSRKCADDRAGGIAKTVHKYFAREGEKQECKDSLEVQSKLLEEAEVLIAEASGHTEKMVRCKPELVEATTKEELSFKFCNFVWRNMAMGESQTETLTDKVIDNSEKEEMDQVVMQSLVRGCQVTAIKAEKVSEAANEVVEKRSLALDEPGEEQCDEASVSAEAGEVYNKEEELARLLKATAEGIEDALEHVEDVDKARIEFYEALSKLDVLEDAERSGGWKEQELGIFSIKRFKRMARQRFSDAIIDFKAQVERKKTKVVEVQTPESGEVDLLEVKPEEQEVRPPNIIVQQGEMRLEEVEQQKPGIKVKPPDIIVQQDEMGLKKLEQLWPDIKVEPPDVIVQQGEVGLEKVGQQWPGIKVKSPDVIVQQAEIGPEKVEQPWPDIKVDKRSHLAGAWRLQLWKEMFCQSEEAKSLSLKVEIVDQWKTRLKSKEEASEVKVAGLDPGDSVEVQQRAET